MELVLTIIKLPRDVSLSETSMVLGHEGGSIGRAAGNDWVLPDPERYVSSKHCSVEFDAGSFYLVDVSTNGTYVNKGDAPVGSGNRVKISDGMVISMGDYDIQVALQESRQSSEIPSPFVNAGRLGPFGNTPLPEPSGAPVANGSAFSPSIDIPLHNESKYAVPSFENNVRDKDAILREEGVLDPMQAIDNAKHQADSPDDLFGGSSPSLNFNQSDHAPFDQQFFTPPKTTEAPRNIIGEDWDMTDYSYFSKAGGPYQPLKDRPPLRDNAQQQDSRRPSAGQFSRGDDNNVSQQMRRPYHQRRATDMPDVPPLPGGGESPSQNYNMSPQQNPATPRHTPSGRSTPAQGTPRFQAPQHNAAPHTAPGYDMPSYQTPSYNAAGQYPHSSVPRDGGGRGAPSAGTGSLVAALGLDNHAFTPEQVAELNNVAGEFIRHTVEGLIQVLRARNTIKNELRLSMTTMQPVDNNPLKFAANTDDALEYLFVRQSKAYMSPVKSVRESFDSIVDHQVAVLAGMRAAFKHLVDKFNPTLLAQKFEAQAGSGLFAGVKKVRNWEAYVEYYQDQVHDLESSFQQLFGEEFIKAYESQLLQLQIARKNQRSG